MNLETGGFQTPLNSMHDLRLYVVKMDERRSVVKATKKRCGFSRRGFMYYSRIVLVLSVVF